MELKEAIARIYKEMKGRLGIQNQPSVFLNHDEENSKDIFDVMIIDLETHIESL